MPAFASAVGDDVKVFVGMGGNPTKLHGFPHCQTSLRERKDGENSYRTSPRKPLSQCFTPEVLLISMYKRFPLASQHYSALQRQYPAEVNPKPASCCVST